MMADGGKDKDNRDVLVVSSQLKSNNNNNNNNSKKKMRFYFIDERHNQISTDPTFRAKVAKWRMKDRMKTVSVALVLCINIGVDPPDVIKIFPCARLECWMGIQQSTQTSCDPSSMPPAKAIEAIGKALQEQYERWQAKARYKQCLDPTVEEVKKLCLSLRRNAKDERVLYHYNGHGVPRPTTNGEIWVFNKTFTQYIPLSIYDLQTWIGSPSIYVFDCSAAGLVVNWFNQFIDQREKEFERVAAAAGGPTHPPSHLRDCILLAACGANEILPMNPEYPADMFTSCLTTPIKMALRWFCSHTILSGVTMDTIDKIPGHLNSRRTPLGELNWIFTAVTDTIAWNVLPRELFQKLFRQDLLVASLFRNFLLAERIMRAANCTPVSSPKLPPSYTHPMWQGWDLAVDICLSQLPALLANPNMPFQHSPFFTEQLTAFEVWLETGSENKAPPEQLPIVLQVLLSQAHRLRALVLLGRFLDLGPWAVNLALSVGIFPYVLKLLQSSATELRQILVFIWAKILALDKSCQLDLVKDAGHHYFIGVLSSTGVPSDQRAMAAFVLTVIVNNCRPGQSACLTGSLLIICLQQVTDPDPVVRRWMILCLAKMWENFEEAKWAAIRDGAHERLCSMLQDAVPEVRAAAVYALGTFIGGAEGSEQRTNIELNIGLTLPVLTADCSPLVRRELVIALSHLVTEYDDKFLAVAEEVEQEERKRSIAAAMQEEERRKKEGAKNKKATFLAQSSPLSTAGPSSGSSEPFSSGLSSVYGCLWKVIIELCADPFPDIATLATAIVKSITNLIAQPDEPPVAPGVFSSPSRGRSGLTTSAGLLRTTSVGAPNPQTQSLKKSATGVDKTPPLRRGLGHQREQRRRSSAFFNLTMPNTNAPGAAPAGNTTPSLASTNPNTANGVGPSPNGPNTATATNNAAGSNNNVDSVGAGGGLRRFASMDFASLTLNGTGVGVDEEYLTSGFYEWSAGLYSRPLITQRDEDDPTSPMAQERRWRATRNERILQEAWEARENTSLHKLDNQISLLDNGSEMASLLLFHPFENVLVVADDEDEITVWNWEDGQKLHVFGNMNPPGTRISSLKLLNDYDRALLMTGSNDGVIRIWKGMESYETLNLVSAWRALPDNGVPTVATAMGKMVLDWQQENGRVLVSGDVGYVRVWDAERELSVQDIPTGSDSCVACLSSQMGGMVFSAGCGDGSVRIFDQRVNAKFSHITTYTEHKGWIVDVAMPKGRDKLVVSGSVSGEIKMWNLGMPSSTSTVTNNDTMMTALAVHDYAPILTTGSQNQKIRLLNFSGEELGLIRYHDGFLGQRIGPVSCLTFHPYTHPKYKLLFAAGATDAIVSIYAGRNIPTNQL